MKNLLMSIATFLLLVTMMPAKVSASDSINLLNGTPVESAETQAVNKRILEIKTMDKSNLSRAEKKDLRTELKAIKASAAGNNNGIYLSLGAIIIVILLLILLL